MDIVDFFFFFKLFLNWLCIELFLDLQLIFYWGLCLAFAGSCVFWGGQRARPTPGRSTSALCDLTEAIRFMHLEIRCMPLYCYTTWVQWICSRNRSEQFKMRYFDCVLPLVDINLEAHPTPPPSPALTAVSAPNAPKHPVTPLPRWVAPRPDVGLQTSQAFLAWLLILSHYSSFPPTEPLSAFDTLIQ